MEKAAISLTGRLVVSQTGDDPWGLLKVPQSLLDGVYKSLHVVGIEKPEDTAHISVFTSDEIKKIGGPDKIEERGKDFHYTLRALRRVEPEDWDEMQYVYFITCSSPELGKLRESYGLSPLVHGTHPFHITVAVKPKVEEKKSAAAEEEEDLKAAKRRRMRNVMLGIAATAGGAYALNRLVSKALESAPALDTNESTGPTELQPEITPQAVDTATPDVKVERPTPQPDAPSTINEYFDYLKDRAPKPAHAAIDYMGQAFKTGDPAELKNAQTILTSLPQDMPVMADLRGAFGDISQSIANPAPGQEIYRRLERAGIPAFDLSQGSRPAQKLIDYYVNSEQLDRIDPKYMTGLLNAVPPDELDAATKLVSSAVAQDRSLANRLSLNSNSDSTLRNLLPATAAEALYPATNLGANYAYGTGFSRNPFARTAAGAAYMAPLMAPANMISNSIRDVAPSDSMAGNVATQLAPWVGGRAIEGLVGWGAPSTAGKLPMGATQQATKAVYNLLKARDLAGAGRLASKKFAPVYLTTQAMDLAGTAGRMAGSYAGGDGGDSFYNDQADRLSRMGQESYADRYISGLMNPAENVSTLLTSAPSTEKIKGMSSQGAVDATNSQIDLNAAKARDLLLRGDVDASDYIKSIRQQADTRFAPQGYTANNRNSLLGDIADIGVINNRKGAPVDEAAKATWIKNQIQGLRAATARRR